MPIEHRIVARSLGYLQALTNRKKDPILKGVVASVLEDTSDPWTAQTQAWTRMVGFSTLAGISKSRVSTQVELWSMSRIQSMVKDHRSLVALSEPDRWFTLQAPQCFGGCLQGVPPESHGRFCVQTE